MSHRADLLDKLNARIERKQQEYVPYSGLEEVLREGRIVEAGITITTLATQYVCAQCHGHLTTRWEEGEGHYVVCVADQSHFGFVTKATVEIEKERSKIEAIRITHDPALREVLPWLPEPEQVTTEQAMKDLYD